MRLTFDYRYNVSLYSCQSWRNISSQNSRICICNWWRLFREWNPWHGASHIEGTMFLVVSRISCNLSQKFLLWQTNFCLLDLHHFSWDCSYVLLVVQFFDMLPVTSLYTVKQTGNSTFSATVCVVVGQQSRSERIWVLNWCWMGHIEVKCLYTERLNCMTYRLEQRWPNTPVA
jgi:hypothetical protein